MARQDVAALRHKPRLIPLPGLGALSCSRRRRMLLVRRMIRPGVSRYPAGPLDTGLIILLPGQHPPPPPVWSGSGWAAHGPDFKGPSCATTAAGIDWPLDVVHLTRSSLSYQQFSRRLRPYHGQGTSVQVLPQFSGSLTVGLRSPER